ncbi:MULTISPECIES: hypothetical protein [unclassified Facklamia]|uniref:hypothetical protein n=1 Tax=Aerococcaceae TaxID=186827 RepID=UPI0013BA0834|nr:MULTISPECIES: hypothetical protein [unclassified Facklamia]NEW65276.1 hypothetical protein [Facklamia sp. 252]NEW68744.1 hypothetical protein [Facklamia sp. 253]QQD66132.1 hypothetical protein JDW14_03230 [Aerococcaceae bacterium zg-252]
MKIIAKGVRRGEELLVEVEDGKVVVNGSEEKGWEYYAALTYPRTVAGTFWPKEDGMMNIHTNLMFYFFDNKPEVITFGEFDENIPYIDDTDDFIFY